MVTKKPMIKQTVGGMYYAFNTPTQEKDFDPTTYEETIKCNIVKSIGTTENAETAVVRSSGQEYTTMSDSSSIDLAIEVVAFDADDLAKMRGELVDDSGLISSGGPTQRPFFGYGKVVRKMNDQFRFEWYPKCQLIENTDDIATSEETFSEQNDTVTIRCYSFDDKKNKKNYVDSESTKFPTGLTEEKFFEKPIVTPEDLKTAIGPEGA